MSNVTINQLPTANTIDGAADILPIYTASALATQGISRNTLLGLASAPVGLTDSQTLTNKILTSPTINGATLSGTLSGTYTIGGTPTFPSNVVTLTGSQTLTNKVLTSPTISAPTITNATISADAVSGFTTSNNGTVYGISVTGGTIGSAAYGAGSISSAAIATNGVAASNLATGAITLGYVQITGSVTLAVNTPTQVTGLTLTVTIPAGGRRIRITSYCPSVYNNTNLTNVVVTIWDGVVGSGTQLSEAVMSMAAANQQMPMTCTAVVSPSAGSKTYNVGWAAGSSGTATFTAAATNPAYLLVEAI